MTLLDLSNITLAVKAQSGGLGSPESGAGGTQLEVTPSRGLSLQVAQIRSALYNATRMRKRSRHGSYSATAQYETELQVGAQDVILAGALGGSWTAAQAFDNTDWGDCTITGTGTTVTFGGGTMITDGIRVGMMAKFANLSVAGNNSVYFPITGLTESVMAVPSGYLVDNGADAAWDIEIAGYVYTPDPFVKQYWTIDEYGTDLDLSKIGSDCVLGSLNFQCQPNQPVKLSFGFGGRNLSSPGAGSSPQLTSPTLTQGDDLVLLDGAIIVDGVARADFTGATFGITAPVRTPEMLTTRTPPDVLLGMFDFAGELTGITEDHADLATFLAETQFDLLFRFSENETDPADFVTVFMGGFTLGGFDIPIGGDGEAVKTLPLFGGRDIRGTEYAETTMLISTSSQ